MRHGQMSRLRAAFRSEHTLKPVIVTLGQLSTGPLPEDFVPPCLVYSDSHQSETYHQRRLYVYHGRGTDHPQTTNQPTLVDGSDLVEQCN